MGLSRALAGLLLASLLSQVRSMIKVEEVEDKVILSCNNGIMRQEGTDGEILNSKAMNLGKLILDPWGFYECNGTQEKSQTSKIQIYYRMCQNCVEMDYTTLAGILVANVIATLLLALGVYCFAGHEAGRLSGAR